MRRSLFFEGAVGVLGVVGAVLILTGLGAALGAARVSNPAAPRVESAALRFSTTEVTSPIRSKVGDEVEVSGALVAPATVVVRAKTAGTLIHLLVSEGNRVDAGQEIGRIDDTEINNRLAERRIAVKAARTQLAQARRQHLADVELAAQNVISKKALQTSRSTLDTAKLQLESALAQLNTGLLAPRDTKLIAPIRGRVSKRHVLVGERLNLEQAVVTIIDLSQLVLAGSVGPHQVRRLVPGMPVDVHIDGLAAPVVGRIERVALAAEPGTRSIGVTVAVPNAEETLRAGLYGMARVALADTAECLTLPLEAVARGSGQDYVWVIENGTLLRRVVAVGRRDAVRGCVEAPSSLTEKSVVLIASFDSLREGAEATVVPPAGASGPIGAR